MARSTAKANTTGLMGPSTMGTGPTIASAGRALTSGQMAECTQVTGVTITCMAVGCISGRTAGATEDSISTIKRMALDATLGPMAGSTMAAGWRASSTEKVTTRKVMEPRDVVCGSTESAHSGSMKLKMNNKSPIVSSKCRVLIEKMIFYEKLL